MQTKLTGRAALEYVQTVEINDREAQRSSSFHPKSCTIGFLGTLQHPPRSSSNKNMPDELLSVLNDVVKIVNFIKARPLNSHIFRTICNEMGSEHETLLLHTEVRWLSRGKVLSRMFELRCEVQEFFVHNPFPLSSFLQDDIWLQKLTYLAETFSTLNKLNLSLQGLSTTIFNTQDKVEALIKKLVFWANWINTNFTECFPLLSEFLQSREAALSNYVKGLITSSAKICRLTSPLWTSLRHGFGIPLMSLLQSHISHFKSKNNYWSYHLMGDTTYFLKIRHS